MVMTPAASMRVGAYAAVGGDHVAGGGGLGPGVEGLDRCRSADGAMWAHRVVVVGEVVELVFGARPMVAAGCACEPFLLGLVEALDFAAGLRMVGPGVEVSDAQCAQGDFQGGATTAARLSGEDGAVVGEHRGRWAPGAKGGGEGCGRRRGR